MEPFVYLPEYRVVVCKHCRYACVAKEARSHLNYQHMNLEPRARGQVAACVLAIEGAIQDQDGLDEFPFPIEPVDPIPFLRDPVYTGRRCNTCGHIGVSDDTMRRHLREEHGWRSPYRGGNVTARRTESTRLHEELWACNVPCQRFFLSRKRSGYFQVNATPSASPPDTRASEILRQFKGQERLFRERPGQTRHHKPFGSLVPDDPIKQMGIPAETMNICAQQLRAMIQPYCQCDHRSSHAHGLDLYTMAEDLHHEMSRVAESRRRSQEWYHETQMERDDLIEPPFPAHMLEWPRPSYRDYSDSGERNIQEMLTGKSCGDLSVQDAEDKWRAQMPSDHDLEIDRGYYVDNICMELVSLKAIKDSCSWNILKDCFSLALCLKSCSTSTFSTHCTLTDDLEPNMYKTTLLLERKSYSICPLVQSVHLVFPELRVNPNSKASNELTDDQQRQLVDEYILPALRQVLPSVVIQEWPQSFDSAVAVDNANARILREIWNLPDNIDPVRAQEGTELLYPVALDELGPFWDEFKRRTNHPGCPFNGAKLFFQSHDLFRRTSHRDLEVVMQKLSELFADFDWDYIPYDRCWVKFGLKDDFHHSETLSGAKYNTTWLYRADCLAHLDRSGCDDRPWVGMKSRQYTQYLMRDVGSMEEVRENDEAKAAPGSHRFIRQFRAYNSHNCHNSTRATTFPYRPYLSWRLERFRQLLVDDQLDAQVSATSSRGHSHIDHGHCHATFKSTLDAWNSQIRNVYKQLNSPHTDTGVQREIIINPHVLLALLNEGIIGKSGCPGRRSSLEPPHGAGHRPFFAVLASDLSHFLVTNSARFISAIHHIASCVRPGGGVQNMSLVAIPSRTQQLSMMRLNRVLVDLLTHSISSVEYAKEPWLFDNKWADSSPNRADDTSRTKYGLRMKRTIDQRGMAFLDSFSAGIMLPSLSPNTDVNIAWPCDATEQHAKTQAEPQTGSFCNRHILPTLVNKVGKDVHPMSGSSSGKQRSSNIISNSGANGSPASSSQAYGSLANNRALIVEATPGSNKKTRITQQSQQDRTTDLIRKIAAQRLETQTGNKPEDSIELTADWSKRRRTIRNSPDTGSLANLNPLLRHIISLVDFDDNPHEAAGLNVSTKGKKA